MPRVSDETLALVMSGSGGYDSPAVWPGKQTLALDLRDARDEIARLQAQVEDAERKRDSYAVPLARLIPQTYGEALGKWPWLECQPHEWDDRTTPENAAWFMRVLWDRLMEHARVLDETRQERDEWRSKALDVKMHPVVVSLRQECDNAREGCVKATETIDRQRRALVRAGAMIREMRKQHGEGPLCCCDNCGAALDGNAAATSDVCWDCWRTMKDERDQARVEAARERQVSEAAVERLRVMADVAERMIDEQEEDPSYSCPDDDEPRGCVLGDRCLCPHPDHTSDECFNLEMAEQLEEDAMGYSTEFKGKFTITPPLNAEEIARLANLCEDGPPGSPGGYCQWTTTHGSLLEWDRGEKFYDYVPWLEYILAVIIVPGGHVVSGTVTWEGEESDDVGQLVVENNTLRVMVQSQDARRRRRLEKLVEDRREYRLDDDDVEALKWALAKIPDGAGWVEKEIAGKREASFPARR